MKHPNESHIIEWFLDGQRDREMEDHLEDCEVCREKFQKLKTTHNCLLGHEISDCDPDVAENLFATAWIHSRDQRNTRTFPLAGWRRGLQPACLFMAGLFLGYLLFSTHSLESFRGGEAALPAASDRWSAPARTEYTAIPTDTASKRAETKDANSDGNRGPEERLHSEYWEKTGFKNAKITPTVRYEDGRNIWGGRFEAETASGALVVMNY
jgi:hypothetical protein